MAEILLNGIKLEPQPASSEWTVETLGRKLNGTDEGAAFARLMLSSPPLKGQSFNWQQFENQVLTSMTAYAPGTGPEGAATTYSSGVVARKMTTYSQPSDRTVRQVILEILVAL